MLVPKMLHGSFSKMRTCLLRNNTIKNGELYDVWCWCIYFMRRWCQPSMFHSSSFSLCHIKLVVIDAMQSCNIEKDQLGFSVKSKSAAKYSVNIRTIPYFASFPDFLLPQAVTSLDTDIPFHHREESKRLPDIFTIGCGKFILTRLECLFGPF